MTPIVAFTTTESAFVGDAGVLVIDVIVGAVGTTVKVNAEFAVAAPSFTVIVISALPVWPDAGVIVTVRFAPPPPKTMFPFGTSVVFADEPLSVTLAAPVSTSPTVNEIADVARRRVRT